MPKYIDKVPGKSFHSFRHNYRDALRRIEAPEATLRALCGWTESNSTSSNYGSGYAPKQLMDWVEKIAYPDLNLKHLYVKQPSSVQ
jgi:integrase